MESEHCVLQSLFLADLCWNRASKTDKDVGKNQGGPGRHSRWCYCLHRLFMDNVVVSTVNTTLFLVFLSLWWPGGHLYTRQSYIGLSVCFSESSPYPQTTDIISSNQNAKLEPKGLGTTMKPIFIKKEKSKKKKRLCTRL